ncbi:pyridoxal phosphate-dependent aminotransferase [Pelagibaculum spongiae]|uniref:Aminotransferase n=1 Tax=Pelagibaculum spongiae TaxID=2080658 RepID=A0A2V1H4A0_9GAMM|nr:pyridoxal phosphate-dependent aminotransferase [Pelagibaculum spongiae]PVZ71605.1 aspartate transaminase [Pelagibaculum spongiae]
MNLKLSNRVKNVKPSPTLAVTARAAELRASGKDIIGLGAGEPDFDTPDHIKEAAVKALADGKTKYTPVDGTPSLKQAIIDKFKRDNGFDYQANQILVSCGGKQSFFNLTQALINPGDEVIIPAPYWVSYPDIVLLADGVPVVVEAPVEQAFKITPEQLAAAITEKTKLVVINSPSNPSGKAYTLAELKALGEVLLQYPDVVVATDDMYEHILWADEPFANILNACPGLYDQCVVMNGVSKAYSMTGWRIGYCAGPQPLIASMKKIQSQSTSNPTSIAQWGAEAALNGPQDCVKEMLEAFEVRHKLVLDGLNAIPGVKAIPSDGTFYSFPSFHEAMEKKGFKNDLDLAEYLLNEAGVALVPGSAFGTPGHMRLSFATSEAILNDALARIRKALEV